MASEASAAGQELEDHVGEESKSVAVPGAASDNDSDEKSDDTYEEEFRNMSRHRDILVAKSNDGTITEAEWKELMRLGLRIQVKERLAAAGGADSDDDDDRGKVEDSPDEYDEF